MEKYLISIGYRELPNGMWQDLRQYEPEKTLEDAYNYEMEMFK